MLPPRARLGRVLSSLLRHLPEQLPATLFSRFEAGTAAMDRLRAEGAVDNLVATLPEAEALWLAEELEARWDRVAGLSLDPVCWLVLPEQLWVGERPVERRLTVGIEGLDSVAEVLWEDPIVGEGSTGVLTVDPVRGDDVPQQKVAVRVWGRQGEQRVVLRAVARLRLRRPVPILSGLRLIIRDQSGKSAGRVRVVVGAEAGHTDEEGVLELQERPEAGTPVLVEGVMAGRLRGESKGGL